MQTPPPRINLTIDTRPGTDIGELAALTQRLRTELLYLDVEDVELVKAGPPPTGSKAGDAVTWGALLVTLGSSGVLPAVVGTVQSWLTRNNQRSVTLEIDGEKLVVSNASPEQQQLLIDSWMQRHRLAEG